MPTLWVCLVNSVFVYGCESFTLQEPRALLTSCMESRSLVSW
jgi:hypothetical protein